MPPLAPPQNLINPGFKGVVGCLLREKREKKCFMLSKSLTRFFPATSSLIVLYQEFLSCKKTWTFWMPRKGIMWNLQSLLPGLPASNTQEHLEVHQNSILVIKGEAAVGGCSSWPLENDGILENVCLCLVWIYFPFLYFKRTATLVLLPVIYHAGEAFCQTGEEK